MTKKTIEVMLSGVSAEIFLAIKERVNAKVARAVISCLIEASARKAMKQEEGE